MSDDNKQQEWQSITFDEPVEVKEGETYMLMNDGGVVNKAKAMIVIKWISGYLRRNVIDEYGDVVELSCSDSMCDKYYANGYELGQIKLAQDLLKLLGESEE